MNSLLGFMLISVFIGSWVAAVVVAHSIGKPKNRKVTSTAMVVARRAGMCVVGGLLLATALSLTFTLGPAHAAAAATPVCTPEHFAHGKLILRPPSPASDFSYAPFTEHIYRGKEADVHYVTSGRDAPPLESVAPDGVPDYVRVLSLAADKALSLYTDPNLPQRPFPAFRTPPCDRAGPTVKPDIYIKHLSSNGITIVQTKAADGAFVVMSNSLEQSHPANVHHRFALLILSVAHEMFHLVQLAYVPQGMPRWIAEGTAQYAAFETGLGDLRTVFNLFFDVEARWFQNPSKSFYDESLYCDRCYGGQTYWGMLFTQPLLEQSSPAATAASADPIQPATSDASPPTVTAATPTDPGTSTAPSLPTVTTATATDPATPTAPSASTVPATVSSDAANATPQSSSAITVIQALFQDLRDHSSRISRYGLRELSTVYKRELESYPALTFKWSDYNTWPSAFFINQNQAALCKVFLERKPLFGSFIPLKAFQPLPRSTKIEIQPRTINGLSCNYFEFAVPAPTDDGIAIAWSFDGVAPRAAPAVSVILGFERDKAGQGSDAASLDSSFESAITGELRTSLNAPLVTDRSRSHPLILAVASGLDHPVGMRIAWQYVRKEHS
jgi:hypothetical protein